MKILNTTEVTQVNGGNALLILGAVAAVIAIAEATYDYTKGAVDGASDGWDENCYTCNSGDGNG